MVLAHCSAGRAAWVVVHRHNTLSPGVDTTTFETVTVLAGAPATSGAMPGSIFDATENGGTTLQWKISTADFGPVPLSGLWGATHDLDDEFGGTFDLTAIPEPTSLALVGFGLAFALRRRVR
jgi:hypothetical protein